MKHVVMDGMGGMGPAPGAARGVSGMGSLLLSAPSELL